MPLPFPLDFQRQYAGPLDVDQVFATAAERTAYLSSPRRYAGQVVSDLENIGKLYQLNAARTAWVEIEAGGSGLTPEQTQVVGDLAVSRTTGEVTHAQQFTDVLTKPHLFHFSYSSTASGGRWYRVLQMCGAAVGNGISATGTFIYDASYHLMRTRYRQDVHFSARIDDVNAGVWNLTRHAWSGDDWPSGGSGLRWEWRVTGDNAALWVYMSENSSFGGFLWVAGRVTGSCFVSAMSKIQTSTVGDHVLDGASTPTGTLIARENSIGVLDDLRTGRLIQDLGGLVEMPMGSSRGRSARRVDWNVRNDSGISWYLLAEQDLGTANAGCFISGLFTYGQFGRALNFANIHIAFRVNSAGTAFVNQIYKFIGETGVTSRIRVFVDGFVIRVYTRLLSHDTINGISMVGSDRSSTFVFKANPVQSPEDKLPGEDTFVPAGVELLPTPTTVALASKSLTAGTLGEIQDNQTFLGGRITQNGSRTAQVAGRHTTGANVNHSRNFHTNSRIGSAASDHTHDDHIMLHSFEGTTSGTWVQPAQGGDVDVTFSAGSIRDWAYIGAHAYIESVGYYRIAIVNTSTGVMKLVRLNDDTGDGQPQEVGFNNRTAVQTGQTVATGRVVHVIIARPIGLFQRQIRGRLNSMAGNTELKASVIRGWTAQLPPSVRANANNEHVLAVDTTGIPDPGDPDPVNSMQETPRDVVLRYSSASNLSIPAGHLTGDVADRTPYLMLANGDTAGIVAGTYNCTILSYDAAIDEGEFGVHKKVVVRVNNIVMIPGVREEVTQVSELSPSRIDLRLVDQFAKITAQKAAGSERDLTRPHPYTADRTCAAWFAFNDHAEVSSQLKVGEGVVVLSKLSSSGMTRGLANNGWVAEIVDGKVCVVFTTATSFRSITNTFDANFGNQDNWDIYKGSTDGRHNLTSGLVTDVVYADLGGHPRAAAYGGANVVSKDTYAFGNLLYNVLENSLMLGLGPNHIHIRPDGVYYRGVKFLNTDGTLVGGVAGSVAWDDVTNKPTTFPPSEHTHDWNTDITNKPTLLQSAGDIGQVQLKGAGNTLTTAPAGTLFTLVDGHFSYNKTVGSLVVAIQAYNGWSNPFGGPGDFISLNVGTSAVWLYENFLEIITSQRKFILRGSGIGEEGVEIVAPNTSTKRVLSLPNKSGTFATTDDIPAAGPLPQGTTGQVQIKGTGNTFAAAANLTYDSGLLRLEDSTTVFQVGQGQFFFTTENAGGVVCGILADEGSLYILPNSNNRRVVFGNVAVNVAFEFPASGSYVHSVQAKNGTIALKEDLRPQIINITQNEMLELAWENQVLVNRNNFDAWEVSIPSNATLAIPVGYTVALRQLGAEPLIIANLAPADITVISDDDTFVHFKTAGKGSLVTLQKTDTNEWCIDGMYEEHVY